MLEIHNLNITFNKNTPNALEAIKDISVSFETNEWTYIIGGNGSGKTTLLKVISGELKPDIGSITLNGFSSSDILFIDQKTMNNLVPAMTIYENLIFGLAHKGMVPNFKIYKNRIYRKIIIDVIKEFNIGLENRLNEQVKFLSGGEQQIVVACRILLSRPKILLIDEFTSALDQKWEPFILDKLKSYAQLHNVTVIAVTHDYSQISNFGERIIMLKNGRVVADVHKDKYSFTTQNILKLFYEKI